MGYLFGKIKKKTQTWRLGDMYTGIMIIFTSDIYRGEKIDTKVEIENTRDSKQVLCWIKGEEIDEFKIRHSVFDIKLLSLSITLPI